MTIRKSAVEEGLSYVDQVKYTFGSESQVYRDFLDTMLEFRDRRIDTLEVIRRVTNLFREHLELIAGFKKFVPPGYRIEIREDGQVKVSFPLANSGEEASNGGRRAFIILPGRPPISPMHTTQSNTSSSTNSPHSTNGNAIDKVE